MSHYNLRHKKTQDLELPIQISLSDSALMAQILGASQPTPSQVLQNEQMSDTETESNDSENGSGIGGELRAETDNCTEQITDKNHPGTSQQINQNLINQAILDQLTKIGSRLDNLEKEKIR